METIRVKYDYYAISSNIVGEGLNIFQELYPSYEEAMDALLARAENDFALDELKIKEIQDGFRLSYKGKHLATYLLYGFYTVL